MAGPFPGDRLSGESIVDGFAGTNGHDPHPSAEHTKLIDKVFPAGAFITDHSEGQIVPVTPADLPPAARYGHDHDGYFMQII